MADSLVVQIDRKKRNIIRLRYDETAKRFTMGGHSLNEEEMYQVKVEIMAYYDIMSGIQLPDADDYMINLAERHLVLLDMLDRRLRRVREESELVPVMEETPPLQPSPIKPASSVELHPSKSDVDLLSDQYISSDSDDLTGTCQSSDSVSFYRGRAASRSDSIRGRNNAAQLARSFRRGRQSAAELATGSEQPAMPISNRARARSPDNGRSRSAVRGQFNQLELSDAHVPANPPEPTPVVPNVAESNPVLPPVAMVKHDPDNPACFGEPHHPVYCLACTMFKEKHEHRLWQCERFLSLSVEIRRKCADAWDICRCCTRIGHITCETGLSCGNNCGYLHNPIFCFNDPMANIEYNKTRFLLKKQQGNGAAPSMGANREHNAADGAQASRRRRNRGRKPQLLRR